MIGRILRAFRARGVAGAGRAALRRLRWQLRRRPVQGVLFVGYVEAALGIGESLRGLLRAVEAQGLAFGIQPFNAGVERRRIGPFMPERYDRRRTYAVNVIEVATDQLPHVLHVLAQPRWLDSLNVLRTYWELAEAPPDWAPLLEHIDEVWAPTRFVAQAMARVFPGPVVVVPPCVEVRQERVTTKAMLGLDEGRFHLLFSFDYQSSPARKNPWAVVRAFLAAFPGGKAGGEAVTLVVKSTGLPGAEVVTADQTALHAALAAAAAADARVLIIERIMSRDEMLGLIACCDCYVSLHRSEGFGLGMAEAMALGTPVIGTDYSGSQDFLDAATGYPVACTLRAVQPGEYPGGTGQVWAEPDEAAAVAAMRAVFAGGDDVRSRVDAGRTLMAGPFGHEAVGAAAAARARLLLQERPRRP